MRRVAAFLAALVLASQALGAVAIAGPADQTELIWSSPRQETDPAAPQSIYRRVSPPVPMLPPPGVSAADPCSDENSMVWAQNGLGEYLWWLRVRIQWCYDFSTISYYFRTVDTGVSYDWNDIGTVSDSRSEPPTGYWQTDSYRKEHFARCAYIPNWTCWNDVYPWVQMLVNAAGQYSSTGGT